MTDNEYKLLEIHLAKLEAILGKVIKFRREFVGD